MFCEFPASVFNHLNIWANLKRKKKSKNLVEYSRCCTPDVLMVDGGHRYDNT